MNENPFVLFGTARTGSSLLKSLLNAHPQIHCDGELFNPSLWSRPLRPQALHQILRVHPRPYIAARKLYVRLHTRRSIYGFKLFERHVADPVQLLLTLHRRGWRILYIWRRSVFDRVLSALVGKATEHWVSMGESRDMASGVTIDLDEFMRTAFFVHDQQIRCAAIAQAVPHLEIVYEDYLRQEQCWQPVYDGVCDFLEVSRATVDSPVRRTWRQPYCECVTNYAGLVEAFRHGLSAGDAVRG